MLILKSSNQIIAMSLQAVSAGFIYQFDLNFSHINKFIRGWLVLCNRNFIIEKIKPGYVK
jgi:hypothetical protein